MTTQEVTAGGPTLYDLTQQSHAILSLILEAGGEITPELEKLFDHVQHHLAEKTDSYQFVMDRLEAEALYWTAKASAHRKVAQGLEKTRERLKEAIKSAMLHLQVDEIVGQDFKFRLSPAKPRLVVNESLIPEQWKMPVTEYVPDKERIKAELDALGSVPGAKLEGGFSLRVTPNTRKT